MSNTPEDSAEDWDDTWEDESIWQPEAGAEDELIFEAKKKAAAKFVTMPRLLPSQFTEFAIRMPRITAQREDETEEEHYERLQTLFADLPAGEDRNFEKFSFVERPYMRRIYDSPANRVLLMAARQVEKSTLLGNRLICRMCLIPSHKVLYVNSSSPQAKTFSNDRVKEPIETSPVLTQYTTNMLSKNVFEKQFVNRSKITMRYAFLNADRCRGIPASDLAIDEFQDIHADNVPVIEQCTAHAPPQYRSFTYAGTPKSLGNNIEKYWSEHSTQSEWVIPCDCKSGEGGRFWNILGEQNIGKRGLICANCGKLIHAMDTGAQWASMQALDRNAAGKVEGKVTFEGYRIPQLMVHWKKWSEILTDYEAYPRDKFYNEVLGISFDSGLRPLNKAQVRPNCLESLSMADVEHYRALSYKQPVYLGVDWGSGENSFTLLVLGTYVDMKFRCFFWHRFEGEDAEPRRMMTRLHELIAFFNVKMIGSDYGGGFDRNDELTRRWGPTKLMKFQYMGKSKEKIVYDGKLGRYKVARTEVMSDIFNAIKRGNVFQFPRWAEFEKPFADDMVNITSEYNEKLHAIQYLRGVKQPDDSFHALLYCFMASHAIQPRTDVLIPQREVNGQPAQDWIGQGHRQY